MNLKKTIHMIFSKPSQRSEINLNKKIGEEPINHVDSVKFLGLVVDENSELGTPYQLYCKENWVNKWCTG